jgi:3-oxoacyl-[acyl-carrier-protein] synthase-3
VIFGDGAGAAVIEGTDDPDRGIFATELHADGRFARQLWVEAPASRYHPRLTEAMFMEGKHFPRMDGQTVFKHAVVKMPEVVRGVLAKGGIEPSALKLFVPHQANLRIAEACQKSLGLRDDQIYNNIQKYGNTTAASIPIALCEGIEARGVTRGDWVALGAFGAGFTWAAALMRW